MTEGVRTVRQFDAVRLRDGTMADVREVRRAQGVSPEYEVELEGDDRDITIIAHGDIAEIVWTMEVAEELVPPPRSGPGLSELIGRRVRLHHGGDSHSCAGTVIEVLGEVFGIAIAPQLLDATVGMCGAAIRGEGCSIVSASVMFVGVISRARGLSDAEAKRLCRSIATLLVAQVGSPVCLDPDCQLHQCEARVCSAIRVTVGFLEAAAVAK